jgi:hypothetical protein
MPVQIQLRNGTAAQWTAANPTLAAGEVGTETDTSKLKIGNGSTAWSSLPYASGTGTVSTVGWTGGIVSIANPTTTPAFTIAGTSGGVPYFNTGTTWATSAALTVNSLMVGGGAGAAPATVSNITSDNNYLQLGATTPLRFADADSSNYVAFKAPTTVATNVTWTLPATDGTASQVLSTNGSGTLSWATATASPLVQSDTLITSSYSLAANKNAMSFGTTTIAPGVSVTIAPLDKWVITTYFGVF